MYFNTDISNQIAQPYDNRKNESKIISKRCSKIAGISNTTHNRDIFPGKSNYLEKRDEKRLRSAAWTNHCERLKALLNAGVNPNSADENGRTALHVACSRGYSDIVKSLLDHQADVNKVDKQGNTPLHLAVCTTSTVTVNLLLQAGCSVSVKGNNGCTPLQQAQSRLWLLQRHTSHDYITLKSQVSEVIEMMKRLVESESQDAQLVASFSSRLNVSQNRREMNDDVKTLLDNLDSLHIGKPHTDTSGR